MTGSTALLSSAEDLAELLGTWERILQGQAAWLARESQRPAEAGAGKNLPATVSSAKTGGAKGNLS
jgi:hypothetical protein